MKAAAIRIASGSAATTTEIAPSGTTTISGSTPNATTTMESTPLYLSGPLHAP